MIVKETIDTGLTQDEAVFRVLESARKRGFEAIRKKDLADGTVRILIRKGALTKVVGIAS